MDGKGPGAWAYWDRLQEVVATCGPYSIVANKSRLEFMVRVRFAGMDSVSERGMSFSFWLKERLDSPRVRKVVLYGRTTGYTTCGPYRSTISTMRCRAGYAGRTRSDVSVTDLSRRVGCFG